MRISDWSSDVCSSDLPRHAAPEPRARELQAGGDEAEHQGDAEGDEGDRQGHHRALQHQRDRIDQLVEAFHSACPASARSEEHTSELQSLMRISYAVFCLKKKTPHLHTVP